MNSPRKETSTNRCTGQGKSSAPGGAQYRVKSKVTCDCFVLEREILWRQLSNTDLAVTGAEMDGKAVGEVLRRMGWSVVSGGVEKWLGRIVRLKVKKKRKPEAPLQVL